MKSFKVILADRSPGYRNSFRRTTDFDLVALPPVYLLFFPTLHEKPQQGYFLGWKEGHLRTCKKEKRSNLYFYVSKAFCLLTQTGTE